MRANYIRNFQPLQDCQHEVTTTIMVLPTRIITNERELFINDD